MKRLVICGFWFLGIFVAAFFAFIAVVGLMATNGRASNFNQGYDLGFSSGERLGELYGFWIIFGLVIVAAVITVFGVKMGILSGTQIPNIRRNVMQQYGEMSMNEPTPKWLSKEANVKALKRYTVSFAGLIAAALVMALWKQLISHHGPGAIGTLIAMSLFFGASAFARSKWPP